MEDIPGYDPWKTRAPEDERKPATPENECYACGCSVNRVFVDVDGEGKLCNDCAVDDGYHSRDLFHTLRDAQESLANERATMANMISNIRDEIEVLRRSAWYSAKVCVLNENDVLSLSLTYAHRALIRCSDANALEAIIARYSK
jgi:hypothetical protein